MFNEFVLLPVTEVAKKHANHNAFCINGRFFSYAQFEETVSKIRKAIKTLGGTPENIGLVANDDLETYASIFAIWLEGHAYVPLQPDQPAERIQEIILQAEINWVVDSSGSQLTAGTKTIRSSNLMFESLDLDPTPASESMLAYILFTSGSTGKPKGVPITRGNVGSFMKSFMEVGFKTDHTQRCLQCFDLTFDVSVQSYLVPLTTGGCAYTVPHDQIKYSYVYGLMEEHQLTFGAMAPSMLRYLRPYFDEIDLPWMKYCILTAEACPLELLKEWSNCIPNAEIFDFYGPTEATIYCTYYEYSRTGSNKVHNGMLSIGKPMNGLRGVIIDEARNVVEAGQKGELCISGGQVAPGYWNNPEKSMEAFVELQIGGVATRFYRTGDLCYVDDGGDIMYSGRIDFQVKIQGYRIELGEIEHHAREAIDGRNAVAVAFQGAAENTEIALFMETQPTEVATVLDHLKSRIPSYMVPSKMISVETFPLNANGKIDRNALNRRLKEMQ